MGFWLFWHELAVFSDDFIRFYCKLTPEHFFSVRHFDSRRQMLLFLQRPDSTFLC
ncbi:hypothetical protein CODIS_22540 [Candidatus Thiodiazotropha endolucinida]|uniref:Uncharacterized protein n=1 Tax=Candidatus Thiodiazotropha endolucinida TaxID=1655433 RepID=A0A7Z0VKZ1_9GAMM|nr:hypothetical protein CODIS_22540 [Candidatus Thiodiazotropha endolucinida]